MTMKRQPGFLYKQRSLQFKKDIRPYVFYALQSGTMAAIFIMLIGSIFYIRLLDEAPPEFPFILLSSLVLLPVLAGGSVRTYLREADQIYLLPLETELSGYLRQAMRSSFLIQALALAAAWLVVWPMVRIGTGSGGIGTFALLLAVLILMKRVQLQARWAELQQDEASVRRLMTALRWVIGWIFTFILLSMPLWIGIFVAAAGWIVYLLVLMQFGNTRRCNWLSLIAEERRQQAAIYRFLNMFVDVPSLQGKPRSIPAPKRLARVMGFRSANTYLFLYFLIWLRSEWFGITIRLTLLGLLLTAAGGSGYLAPVLYALMGLIAAVQLKELQKAYRDIDWTHIYPLPLLQREQSARRVRWLLHTVSLVIMSIPLYVQTVILLGENAFFSGPVLLLALTPVCGLIVSAVYHRYR